MRKPDILSRVLRRLSPAERDWSTGDDETQVAKTSQIMDPTSSWDVQQFTPMPVRIDPTPESELVREACERVLRERIELLGVERSGAYEHYQMQLDCGLPVPCYELAIVDLVRRRLPNLRSYHEIGSGLGMLPFALAYEGFAAVGIEGDQRRHLTAMSILRELAAHAPQIEAQCRLIGAAFPEAVTDIDVSDSMAIVTDLVCTHTREQFERISRGLTRYRYVLLDMQRFCSKRESVEEYQDLLDDLVRFGLVPHPEMIDMGTEGCYYLFESTTVRQQRNRAGLSAPSLKTVMAARAATEALVVTPLESGDVAVSAPAARLPGPVLPPSPQRAAPKRFGGAVGLSALLTIGIPTLLGVVYYEAIAANEYVTTFEFAVRSPVKAITSGVHGESAMSPDAFVIADYINGEQSVEDVGKNLNVRAMFSRPHGDFLSRLGGDVTLEGLTTYWQDMVNAHFDLISGNVSVLVRAFTARDSLNLAQALIASSDETFRRLNSQAQHDLVRLADESVTRAEQRLNAARQELLAYRQKSGILDAGKVAVSSTALTDNLRKELANLLTQYTTLRDSSPHSPALPVLRTRIAAYEAQIKGGAQTQNSAPIKEVTPEELGHFETLELNRQFAEKQYTEALSLHEKAYLSAQDQQSYLALFARPQLAQRSMYPDRLRGIATIVLAAAAAWFVGILITYAVKDHLM